MTNSTGGSYNFNLAFPMVIATSMCTRVYCSSRVPGRMEYDQMIPVLRTMQKMWVDIGG